MPDPNLFRLRVGFVKQGRLALLSHLEIARALERAVRRANLPFAVSQGFSPHMKIAFGAALPVGVGSTCEIFDLQMTRYVKPEEALSALQQASVEDLMPTECHYIGPRDAAASVAYPVGTYLARLSAAPGEGFVVPEEVRVVRKKKEKILRVADYLVGELQVQGDAVRFELEAKPTGSLRPDVLLNACVQAANASAEQAANVAGADADEQAAGTTGGQVAGTAGGQVAGTAGGQVAGAAGGQVANVAGAASAETGEAGAELLRVLSLTRIAQRAMR